MIFIVARTVLMMYYRRSEWMIDYRPKESLSTVLLKGDPEAYVIYQIDAACYDTVYPRYSLVYHTNTMAMQAEVGKR